MSFQQSIQSQYLAALAMLQQSIEKCPDSLWVDRTYSNVFSQVVAHTLFYTHFYLHPGPESFKPWQKHREGINKMGLEGEAFSKADLLEYLELVRQQVVEKVNALDLESPSGFHWLPFNRMETHFYNMRHLQQHIGELFERLGTACKIEVHWVSTG